MDFLKISLSVLLSIILLSCDDSSPTETPAASAPTIDNDTLTFSDQATHSITVTWEAASDGATDEADLRYRLLYSTEDNLDSVADAEENGTEAMAYTKNTLTKVVEDLDMSATYYFVVIVKNDAGKKSIYEVGHADTTCFVASTLITLADGTSKQIDQIKVGDFVKSFDEKGGITSSRVSELLEHESSRFITLSAGELNLSGTPNHPIYTNSSDRQNHKTPGFRNLGKFQLGDRVYIEKSRTLAATKVTKLEKIESRDKVKVYNLHLQEGPSTFFANGIAVHNY